MTRYAGSRGAVSQPPAASGNLIPRQSGRPPGRVPGVTAGRQGDRGESLRAFWLSPQGLVTLAVTGFAVVIRLYLLTRLRYLTGITEYDDGVYLGGAISLISGIVPYHGFAFVQPPGILLLMAPAGLLAKVSAVSSAMAVARLLTVGASAACVTLLGFLVRHRGALVTLVTCGTLAVYPDDIMAAHTLLLEPWMNLLILAGACVAFRDGRLAAPRQLLGAGMLFGFAGAVKYWAAIPALVLLAVCLTADRKAKPREAPDPPSSSTARRRPHAWSPRRTGRAVRFACGVLAGFALPVLPFAAPWPALFVRSTLLDQVSRAGSAVPEPLRLAHLTGLADLLNDAGKLTFSGNEGSLFARGDVTAAATWATGWLPVAVAAVLTAFLGLGFAAGQLRARACNAAAPKTGAAAGSPGPLEWYALITLSGTLAAVLGYSAFFYHYCDFAAPWLAIAAGYAAGALSGMFAPGTTRRLTAVVAAAFIVVASFQAWELSGSHAPDVQADATLIPPGGCVVSDEISLTIAANRFPAGAGNCPDVLDSLAMTLVAGNGVSVQDGAKTVPRVAAEWQAVFSKAQYVWLSGTSGRRIAWTPGLREWFARSFRLLHPPEGGFSEGQVYVRRA